MAIEIRLSSFIEGDGGITTEHGSSLSAGRGMHAACAASRWRMCCGGGWMPWRVTTGHPPITWWSTRTRRLWPGCRPAAPIPMVMIHPRRGPLSCRLHLWRRSPMFDTHSSCPIGCVMRSQRHILFAIGQFAAVAADRPLKRRYWVHHQEASGNDRFAHARHDSPMGHERPRVACSRADQGLEGRTWRCAGYRRLRTRRAARR